MSTQCYVDRDSKQSHEAHGSIEEIDGINTYKTSQDKSAIVVFTDVFENTFINIQRLVDSFVQGSQTTVLIPDCFNEDPADPNLGNHFPVSLKKHPLSAICAVVEKFLSTI